MKPKKISFVFKLSYLKFILKEIIFVGPLLLAKDFANHFMCID